MERQLWDAGVKHVIGVDEAGRGPLAGSVFAAAVCIPMIHTNLIPVADSKKLSAKARSAIYEQMMADTSLKIKVVESSHSRIDEINILQATLEAMQSAVLQLCGEHGFAIDDCYVLVDGNKCPKLPMRSKPIISGDASVYSIAMASIAAKVSRDRVMVEMDALYPQYGFEKHKGYPTKEHILAIHKYGPCAIHRLSFKPLKGRFSQ
jgi:ribonuclease HII